MPTTYYRRKSSRARTVLLVLGALLAVFVLIQFAPYGRDHTNPPVTAPFKWSSAQAKAIAKRSCYDCHSNKTKSWWAIKIAPFSWLAQHDISAGRARVNFSEWNGGLSAQGLQHTLDRGMPRSRVCCSPWALRPPFHSEKLTRARPALMSCCASHENGAILMAHHDLVLLLWQS